MILNLLRDEIFEFAIVPTAYSWLLDGEQTSPNPKAVIRKMTLKHVLDGIDTFRPYIKISNNYYEITRENVEDVMIGWCGNTQPTGIDHEEIKLDFLTGVTTLGIADDAIYGYNPLLVCDYIFTDDNLVGTLYRTAFKSDPAESITVPESMKNKEGYFLVFKYAAVDGYTEPKVEVVGPNSKAEEITVGNNIVFLGGLNSTEYDITTKTVEFTAKHADGDVRYTFPLTGLKLEDAIFGKGFAKMNKPVIDEIEAGQDTLNVKLAKAKVAEMQAPPSPLPPGPGGVVPGV